MCAVVDAQHLPSTWGEPEGDMLPIPIMSSHLPNVDPVKQLHIMTRHADVLTLAMASGCAPWEGMCARSVTIIQSSMQHCKHSML